jgi:arabinose-5-phosphate isomerase
MDTLENKQDQRNTADSHIILAGQKTLQIESRAILDMVERIDHNFAEVVRKISAQKAPFIITGLGKSGIIGRKIAATFASIGIPTLFLHAVEAIHGDLGIIANNSLVMAISNSGETEELVKILPHIARRGCTLIAMTGNMKSTLAERSDYILNTQVQEEACGHGLVPTSSTTAMLAMGDALAEAILQMRGFREEEFAENHPGGSLGKRLLTLVADLMHCGDEIPTVNEGDDIYQVISEMSRKRFGTTFVLDDSGTLVGVVTDGDLRRLIEKKKEISGVKANSLMSKFPRMISRNSLAAKAALIMEQNSITALAVTEDGKSVEGILHLHDLLKAGIA